MTRENIYVNGPIEVYVDACGELHVLKDNLEQNRTCKNQRWDGFFAGKIVTSEQ